MKKGLILLGVSLFLFFSWEFSWAQNSSELEAIQKDIKEKGLSWTAGETDISRMTEAEKKGMLGGLPPEPGSPERPREGIERFAKLSMLSSFSWGTYNGYNWMTSIKNQGYCGSCWAFAACEDFEAVQKIRLYQPYREIDVSEQNIVSCWKGDCNDWNLDGTLESFKNNGTPDETCFPYVSGSGYVPPCANRCSDWLSRALFIDDWGRYDSPAVATIKGEIQNYGPVMTWIDVFTDFRDFYTGGVYVHTGGTHVGGHFVVLYGWDDGNNCWLAKNSWGTGWGETGPDGTGGWFRIRMGTNEVGCESWVYWLNPGPLPNVVHTTPSGWTYPVVPRNNNTATWTSCSITPALSGNKDSTWINLAFMNDGSFIARDIYSRVFIDAEWYASWHWLEWLNPGDSYGFNNVGAFNIRGGRHTFCDSLDWDNTVFETDENDNAYPRQFVWSPYVLAENTPVDRWTPPWKGYLTYPNSDGFQFTRPTVYAAGVGIIPHHASDDYDLNIYSNYSGSESGFSSLLKSSTYGGGYTDFVIGTYTSSPRTTYPAVIRYANNNAGFHIDATSSIGRYAIPPVTWTGHSLPAYRVLNVYEVELIDGECYKFHLDNTSGNANLGLAIYPARPGFYARGDYKAMSNVSGPGGDEGFHWTADTTGWFPLVVYKYNYGDYDDANTYTLSVTLPYITVTAPDGGENWCAGSSHYITWDTDSVCIGPTVMIEYSTDGGSFWTLITEAAPNNGSYNWEEVPNTPSTTCRVKITDNTYPSTYDVSNADFTITSPSIIATAPNGGENWMVGSSHNITWTATCLSGPVKIELSRNGGSTWATLAASTPNTGSWTWSSVTGPASTTCKVRISDAADGIPSDQSDRNFIIYISCASAPRCILFDETHGYITEFDHYTLTGWYSELGNLLVAQGYSVQSLTTTFTYSNIQEFDVLALVAPQRVFNSIERSAINQFLKDGKEIVLLGEYGYLHGDSARYVINDLMDSLGINIHLNDDVVGDSTNNDGGAFYWPEIPHFLTPHALTEGVRMIVPYYTSSVSVGSPAQVLAWGDDDSYVVPETKDWGNGASSSDAGQTGNPGATGSRGSVPVLAINENGCERVYVGGDMNIWDNLDWDGDGIKDLFERNNEQLALNVFGWECKESIRVVSPNGGENWCVGSTHDITWTCSGIANLKIEYTTNNGTSWMTILPSTVNDGSEPWVIPNTPSDSCLVKISDATDDIPQDTSDSLFTISATGVSEDEEEKAFTFSLAQNFPNPFNPNTSIQFSLPVSGRVSLKIYNLSGQEVRTLINEEKRKGEYEVLWDGKDNSGKNVASGIYFYHIRAKNFTETKKMVLLK